MITLKEQFNEEQASIADKLKLELEDSCHELEEFSSLKVFGLREDNGEKSVLLEIGYSDPEENGNLTIFDCY